ELEASEDADQRRDLLPVVLPVELTDDALHRRAHLRDSSRRGSAQPPGMCGSDRLRSLEHLGWPILLDETVAAVVEGLSRRGALGLDALPATPLQQFQRAMVAVGVV